MDWAPAVNPFIADDNLDRFRYDTPQETGTSVPTVLQNQGGEFTSIPLRNDGDWDEWYKSDIFRRAHLDNSSEAQGLSGFHLLMSPLVKPSSIVGLAALPVLFPRPHNNLPFSKDRWKRIAQAFLLHKTILHPVRRNQCQSTFLPHKHGGTDLDLHTAVAEPYNKPGSISLSCTYFRATRLSLAVIYACDANQVQRVTELLQASSEAASHPFLMVGVFAELQLNRMQGLVREVHELGDRNKRLFENSWITKSTSRIRELNMCLREGIAKAKDTEEQLRTTRAQLKEMAGRIDEQEESWKSCKGPNDTGVRDTELLTSRFRCRFKEIDLELEGLMAQCRMAAEQQTDTGTLSMAEVSRLEAKASRLEARASRAYAVQSKYLATIATIFLPITSVATIFAVPAFKFDNRWIDGHFDPVNGSSSSAEDNGPSEPGDSLKPVFSGYGVIFIFVSVVVTCATNYAYYKAKQRSHAKPEEEGDELELVINNDQESEGDATELWSDNINGRGKDSDTGSLMVSSQATGSRRRKPPAHVIVKSWFARRWLGTAGRNMSEKGSSGDSPV